MSRAASTAGDLIRRQLFNDGVGRGRRAPRKTDFVRVPDTRAGVQDFLADDLGMLPQKRAPYSIPSNGYPAPVPEFGVDPLKVPFTPNPSAYDDIRAKTSRSTRPPSNTANAPVNVQSDVYDGPPFPDYQVPATPSVSVPRGRGMMNPNQIADMLINSQLDKQALVAGAAIGGAGALGLGVNAMQGDSNGNVVLNPITQAGILGGLGGFTGSGVVEGYQAMMQGRQAASSVANAELMSKNQLRNRNRGAVYGAGAGLLLSVMDQLGDRHNDQY